MHDHRGVRGSASGPRVRHAALSPMHYFSCVGKLIIPESGPRSLFVLRDAAWRHHVEVLDMLYFPMVAIADALLAPLI